MVSIGYKEFEKAELVLRKNKGFICVYVLVTSHHTPVLRSESLCVLCERELSVAGFK